MEALLALLASAFLGSTFIKVADKHTKVFSGPFRLLFGKQKDGGLLPPFMPWAIGLFREKKEGASFLDPWQIKQFFSPKNSGLLLDGHKYRLSPYDSFGHCVLFAPSRMGKSTQYVMPNIFSLHGDSLVITDLKGELHEKTSGYLKSQGYDIQVLNLHDITKGGSSYNPLAHIKNYSDISEIAHILIRSANAEAYDKDPMWFRGAETLLKVIISALHGMRDPEMLHLPNVLRLLQNMGYKKDFEVFLDRYADDTAWNQYQQIVNSNEKMVQSYYAIAVNSLDIFNDPELAQVFASNMIDFTQLRKRKTAFFLIVPPLKLKEYSVIINLIYTELFKTLMAKLPSKSDKNVYVMGDEWGHTSVPNFSIIATTIGQYRVSLSIVLQSLSQMEENYGKIGSKTILEGGMGAKLFYGAANVETSQWVSDMVGKERIKTRNRNGDYSYRENNLLNPDRVRTLANEEGLLIFRNREPVHFTDMRYCFEHNLFKRYMSMPQVPFPQRPKRPLRYVNIGRRD